VRIEGQHRVALPRQRVFEALQDPAILRASTPGLTRLDETAPGHFGATLELKLPAISGRFDGTVDVIERAPPERMRMRLRGKGAPGFVDGTADLALAEDGGGTLVRYVADATVGGQVARLGQRMISGVAKELAGQFFETFEKAAGAGAAASATPDHAGPSTSSAPPVPLPAPPNPGLAGLRLLWRLLLRALGLRRD
jgi:carbon monoxide dehydrogenase subunit G